MIAVLLWQGWNDSVRKIWYHLTLVNWTLPRNKEERNQFKEEIQSHLISQEGNVYQKLTGKTTPTQQQWNWTYTLSLTGVYLETTEYLITWNQCGIVNMQWCKKLAKLHSNLNTNTIDVTDASKKLAHTAIYARFLEKDGTYSCQLKFSTWTHTGITNLWMMLEPARATQNHPEPGKSHPEPTRATQQPPRAN